MSTWLVAILERMVAPTHNAIWDGGNAHFISWIRGFAYNNSNPLFKIYSVMKLRLWPPYTILLGMGTTSILSVGYEGSPTIIATLNPRYIHNNCYCSTWSKVGSTNESRNNVKSLLLNKELIRIVNIHAL